MTAEPVHDRQAWVAVILFSLGIILFHLGSAAVGHPFYRDQHLGPAIEYARHGVDLLRPVIVGFTATDTPVPQELPLWQAAAGIALRLGGERWGWANAVSLVAFFSLLWPLHRLARSWVNRRAAAWSLAFLLAQPIVVVFAGAAGTDGFSLAVCVWFLFFVDRMLEARTWGWFLATACIAALAAVTKAPFFLAAGFTSLLMLCMRHRRSAVAWAMLAGCGLFALGVLWAWTKCCDRELARAEFLFWDVRLSNPAMRRWYFGDWAYRLNPANWAKGGWMALNSLFGSFALSGLFLWGLCVVRPRLGWILFLGGAGMTLVFSHLVLVHRHYYLMFAPAVAVFGAAAGVDLLDRAGEGSGFRRGAANLLLLVILGLSTVQGLIGMEVVQNYDPYPHQMAALIRRHTRPDERLLVQGGGWGGNLFLLSGRRGLSIQDTQLLADPSRLARLRQLGYTKLVMVSESPLIHALQETNPGSADRVRGTYRSSLAAPAATWPSLLETSDLVIKSLPE